MPMFEFMCQTPGCIHAGFVVEKYLSHWNNLDPQCPECKATAQRLMSGFAIPLCGVITQRYNDKKLEGAHQEGHFAWRKNTPDGNPKLEFIETFQQQREFAKAEGLISPTDMGPVEIGADGKSSSSRGLPGCW